MLSRKLSEAELKQSQVIENEETDELKPTPQTGVLARYIPVVRWLPKYTKFDAFSDLIAGITLGLTIIPQSIAYAGLMHVDAQYGLYSTFMGAYVYIIFGTTKEISLGPSALISLLTGEKTKGLPPDFPVLLGFLAGCIELLMGIANLGFLVDFISIPVTSGFTSASAVIIVVSQIQGLLGLKLNADAFVMKIVGIFSNIHRIKAGDAIMGFTCIAILLFLRKVKDFTCCLSKDKYTLRGKVVKNMLWVLSISRNALVVLVAASVAYKLQQVGEVPFALSGKVEPGFPTVSFPPMSSQNGNETYSFTDMCSKLKWGIIEVPLVAVLANIAIAKAFARGAAIDASQEMRALGMCNIVGSHFRSMPTSGAFTRSVLSSASGVRTPMAGLYSGTMALLAVTYLTPLFTYIPKATLSAMLISAVVFMIDWKILVPLWSFSKRDLFTTVSTFVVSLAYSVEAGLLFGVVLNMANLMYLWARPSVEVKKFKTSKGDEYVLIRPDIGLFYPAINFLRETVRRAGDEEGQGKLPLVLDCERFKDIDYTAGKGIQALTEDFAKKNQQLLLLNASPAILKQLLILGKNTPLKSIDFKTDIIENGFADRVVMGESYAAPVSEPTDNEAASIEMESCAVRMSNENEKNRLEEETLLASNKSVSTLIAKHI